MKNKGPIRGRARKRETTLWWNYYRTLLPRTWNEMWKWGKEQVIVILLAIATLALQIKFGLLRSGDLRVSVIATVAPYFGLLLLFFLYHLLFRVPVILYAEQAAELKEARDELKQKCLYLWPFAVTDIQGERIDYQGEIPIGGRWKYHIFIHPEFQLSSPNRFHAKEFRLEINFHGHKQYPKECTDVEKWEMVINPSLQWIPLVPLPRKFEIGRPYEGWLHFVTEFIEESELRQTRMRLYVESEIGPAFTDIIVDFDKLHNKKRHFHLA